MRHTPTSHSAGRLGIDFDGTIAQWGPVRAECRLIPGAAEALQAFEAAGWDIWIITSRLSDYWLTQTPEGCATDADEQRGIVKRTLLKAGVDVPLWRITGDKLPCRHYIDDMAHRFEGDWPAVAALVAGPG